MPAGSAPRVRGVARVPLTGRPTRSRARARIEASPRSIRSSWDRTDQWDAQLSTLVPCNVRALVASITSVRIARGKSGVAIAYDVVGTGPIDVVFLHGWAGSRRFFDETIAALDLDSLRALALDLRGHGDSEDGERYSLADLDDDIIAVADDAGAERFVLVGFSMSAKFASHLACMQPERVLGQILVAGCPATELPLPAEVIEDWCGRAGDAERMIDISLSLGVKPATQEAMDRFGRDAARVRPAALRGTVEAITSESFAEHVGNCRVPTLVVGGRADPMFPPDALQQGVVDPIPGATLALLDCSHDVPLEQPAAFAELVQTFVDRLEADPSWSHAQATL